MLQTRSMNRFPMHRDLHYDYHSSHPNLHDMAGINMGRLYNSHEYLPNDYRRYNHSYHSYHRRETPLCSSPDWWPFRRFTSSLSSLPRVCSRSFARRNPSPSPKKNQKNNKNNPSAHSSSRRRPARPAGFHRAAPRSKSPAARVRATIAIGLSLLAAPFSTLTHTDWQKMFVFRYFKSKL